MKKFLISTLLLISTQAMALTAAQWEAQLLALPEAQLFQRAVEGNVGSCFIGDATNNNCPQCACNYYASYTLTVGAAVPTPIGIPADTGCLELPSTRFITTQGTPTASELSSGANRIKDAMAKGLCKLGENLALTQFSRGMTIVDAVEGSKVVFTSVSNDSVTCYLKGLLPAVNLNGQQVEPYVAKSFNFCTRALSTYRARRLQVPIMTQAQIQLGAAITNITTAQNAHIINAVMFSSLSQTQMLQYASTDFNNLALQYPLASPGSPAHTAYLASPAYQQYQALLGNQAGLTSAITTNQATTAPGLLSSIGALQPLSMGEAVSQTIMSGN